MNEANVRRKVYRLCKQHGYWPITQTDLYAPFNKALADKFIGMLIGWTKKFPAISASVFGLKGVLDKATAKPPKGRPDILVMHPTGLSVVIEVKALHAGETSFPLDRIEDKQRKWLTRWADDGGRGYIALGVIRKHGSRDFLEHLYIVDWLRWCEVELETHKVQKSIPYISGPGFAKAFQDINHDILHLFETFEWYKDKGEWHATDGAHSLKP